MPSTSSEFPSQGLQVLVSLTLALGMTVITHCLSRSLAPVRWTCTGLRSITFARFCLIMVFINSWLFVFSIHTLTFGFALEFSNAACATAGHVCTVFYGSAKVFIYLFLAERVHVVWSRGQTRFASPMYRLCIAVVVIYMFPGIVMLINSRHIFRSGDGACIIGLAHDASYYVFAYDVATTVVFTALFLWPIFQSTLRNAFIRQVAVRTFWATVVALSTSTANVLILALLEGRELGWICLTTCAADITVNAFALFWVSWYGSKKDDQTIANTRQNYDTTTGTKIRFKVPHLSTQSSDSLSLEFRNMSTTWSANNVKLTTPEAVHPKPLEGSVLFNHVYDPDRVLDIRRPGKDMKTNVLSDGASDYTQRTFDTEATMSEASTSTIYEDAESEGPPRETMTFAAMETQPRRNPNRIQNSVDLSSFIVRGTHFDRRLSAPDALEINRGQFRRGSKN
ncbi:hypothetical protein GYMLUDRAFT_46436 [Collybiopsis luxurians FD-317 M1]|uniref:Transmembrane protein n=1 Tax=Collybiopsis luxurians FD-317 M1 TaxID=944289 RepID=A0A0D0B1X6_9AGAR|nr:hypothetical protein GYMLUDRAFT_46436 [Collybiopsis luxurians FD-317 M1]